MDLEGVTGALALIDDGKVMQADIYDLVYGKWGVFQLLMQDCNGSCAPDR